jgi:predicted SAM-dependent methyltransferase
VDARRRALDIATQATARLRAGRVYAVPAGEVRINLGAGSNVAPGWVNIDGSLSALAAGWPAPLIDLAWRFSTGRRWVSREQYRQLLRDNRFIHHDLRHGIPLGSETVDIVYSSHFFEHIYRDEADSLLRETFRVLKPGGLVRINVPDLTMALEAFSAGLTEDGLAFFFPRSESDADGAYGQHRYMYDYGVIRGAFEAAGFTGIVKRDRGEGAAPDLDVLERRSPAGLYVEARRPR